MNKKLLIILMLVMLISVSFVSAKESCDTKNVLHCLKKALHIYYTDPSESVFTAGELREMLDFYFSIKKGKVRVDCSEQIDKIEKAGNLSDKIPACADGAKYGKCSDDKPFYCYAGRSVPRCRLCGCPEGQWCDVNYVFKEKGNLGRWGKCYIGTEVACVVDDDCGVSNYTGNYYCKDGNVYQDYTKYTCLNPGKKKKAGCAEETTSVLIDECLEGEECVEGESECQLLTCDDGILYNECSITKPKYCDNKTGTLVDNCQECGCDTGTCLGNGRCEIFIGELTISIPHTDVMGVDWDGQSLWAVAKASGYIYELDKLGNVLSTFNLPPYTSGLESVDSYLYIAKQSYELLKVNKSGTIIETFNLPFDSGSGITWDGNNFWITDIGTKTIKKVDSEFNVIFSIPSPNGYTPYFLDWKDGYLWLSAQHGGGSGNVYQIDPEGNIISEFPAPAYNPRGITWIDSIPCVAFREGIIGPTGEVLHTSQLFCDSKILYTTIPTPPTPPTNTTNNTS